MGGEVQFVAPTRIELATNDADKLLVLEDIERFSDGSGWKALLRVRSGWLAFEHDLYFSEKHLASAISSLATMSRNGHAIAKLTGTWEPDFLCLELHTLGHVEVRGEIGHGDSWKQIVRFSFQTDQTVIAPLMRDLSALLHTGI
jgi:hypothetical protein